MNNDSMADFIRELRKAKGLTQRQLAERLNITDKAVSKWERGLGFPDIATLSPLAEILGVTVNDLLSGRQAEIEAPPIDCIVQETLQYAEKVAVAKGNGARTILKWTLTLSALTAIIVCILCDLAISKRLSWSLYPILSIVFAWLIAMPLLSVPKNRAAASLLSFSIFIVPFLCALECLIGGAKWLIPLGVPIAVVSIVYLWGVWALVVKTAMNRWYALGSVVALAIPLTAFVNLIASKYVGEPLFDVWDAMSLGLLVVIAAILFATGRFRKKEI